MNFQDLKRYMVPGALVIGGVTAGSMLAPVAFAAAAEDDSADTANTAETTDTADTAETTDTADTDDDEPRGHGSARGHRGHALRHVVADVAAETLDMTADELRAAFTEGKSLADIADDQGVALDDLKASLSAAAQERIDESVADDRIDADRAADLTEGIDERIDELVERTPGEGRGAKGDATGHGRHGDRGERAEAMAEFLGLSTDDLRAAFTDGQTLAEVAEAQGVSEDDLVAFILQGIEERLDQAVTDGRIDADDVEEKLTKATDRIEERINAEPGDQDGRGRGHRSGNRMGESNGQGLDA